MKNKYVSYNDVILKKKWRILTTEEERDNKLKKLGL